jgi:metallophosphoesterase superfamily enzyme
MNDEKTISFAYIAGHEHAAVSITEEQFNQIKSILYGKAEEA